MAIAITASAGLFDAAAERAVSLDVLYALLEATDAVDNEAIASTVGVALHVVPAERFLMGGKQLTGVRIDVVLPGIALASFRRRRRFIADATAAVAAHANDPDIASRTVVHVLHATDGGFGIGGRAFTNDELDEGPE